MFAVTNFPSDAFQKGVITLHSDDVPCDDTFFLHQVETKFQEKLSNKVMHNYLLLRFIDLN